MKSTTTRSRPTRTGCTCSRSATARPRRGESGWDPGGTYAPGRHLLCRQDSRALPGCRPRPRITKFRYGRRGALCLPSPVAPTTTATTGNPRRSLSAGRCRASCGRGMGKRGRIFLPGRKDGIYRIETQQPDGGVCGCTVGRGGAPKRIVRKADLGNVTFRTPRDDTYYIPVWGRQIRLAHYTA